MNFIILVKNFPDTPITVENAQQLCKVDPKHFILKKKESDETDGDEIETLMNDSKADLHDSKNCIITWFLIEDFVIG